MSLLLREALGDTCDSVEEATDVRQTRRLVPRAGCAHQESWVTEAASSETLVNSTANNVVGQWPFGFIPDDEGRVVAARNERREAAVKPVVASHRGRRVCKNSSSFLLLLLPPSSAAVDRSPPPRHCHPRGCPNSSRKRTKLRDLVFTHLPNGRTSREVCRHSWKKRERETKSVDEGKERNLFEEKRN